MLSKCQIECLMTFLFAARRGRSGQGLVEYAFLIGLLVVVAIATLSAFGEVIGTKWLPFLSGTLANTEANMSSM